MGTALPLIQLTQLTQLIQLTLAIFLSIACLYYLFTVYAAWRFFRHAPSSSDMPAPALPPVSILKPLKGASPGLYTNLASFCRLNYPTFQLLCGIRDPHDPALAVVQRLQQDFPSCDIVPVITAEVIGSNYKVSTLHHLSRQAQYDMLVISDSDVCVEPDYLRAVIPPLIDPKVGLVTCPYRSETNSSLSARLEALIINTSFTPSVLVASQVEKTTYAFGATIAVKRSCLDEIGGFAALADYLADDYYLGYLMTQRGYRAHIVPHVVETRPDVTSLGGLFYHQLRWARTQRTCRPGGHCGSCVTYGTVWALLGLSAFWSVPFVWRLSVCTICLRFLSAAVVSHFFLKASQTLRTLWLIPFSDILSFVVWCASLRGNTVRWGEYTFRVRRNGKMTQIAHTQPMALRSRQSASR